MATALMGVTALALVAGAVGCSGDDDTSSATTTSTVAIETTTTTEVAIDGEGTEQIFVYEPQVGDCFDRRQLDPDDKATRAKRDIVLRIDCDLAHRFEVFDVLTFDNAFGIYPGDQALQQFANERCTTNFDGYIGQRYELSAIEISFWAPSSQDWDRDPQPFACTLYDPKAGLTVGTLAGSAR